MNPKTIPAMFLVHSSIATSSAATELSNRYTHTNLVYNVPGLALTVDSDLVDPWGMAVSAIQPFRIAMNGKGKFRSYDANGAQQDPRGVIAVPAGVTAASNPTGVAANNTGLFIPPGSLSSPFLFANRQGTISGEFADGRGDFLSTTIMAVDHGSQGTENAGLAVLTPDCCAPYLAVANFRQGNVETFTFILDPLNIPGAFIDPNLPPGYAPSNPQVAGKRVFLAYALQDAALHDPVVGPGNGIVDIYNLDRSFVRRFASNGPLNVPSAIVQAGANFGTFSNDILIGNFSDGLINAFDPNTGQFLGSMKDGNGNPIVNPDLHSMVFSESNAGNPDTLFLTAALEGGANGIFAEVSKNTTGPNQDFSLTASPSSAIVSVGQATTFSIKASPIANFRGAFSFSCDSPAADTCTLGSPSIDVLTGSATIAFKATPSPAATPNPIPAILFPGMLFAGLGFRRRHRAVFPFVALAIGLLASTLAGVTGCSSNGHQMSPQPTTRSLSIAASVGPVSHTTMLTINVQ